MLASPKCFRKMWTTCVVAFGNRRVATTSGEHGRVMPGDLAAWAWYVLSSSECVAAVSPSKNLENDFQASL